LQVTSFPTLRLYKADGTFVSFQGSRTFDDIIAFLARSAQNNYFVDQVAPSGGCEIKAHLNVPRVQGNIYLTVGGNHESSPNPDLVNMSHVVDHLSFNDADANILTHLRVHALKAEMVPASVVDHIAPLDGKEFITESAQDVSEHYLKIVNTKIGKKKDFYQITHTAKPNRGEVPQVKFSYDFSPLTLILRKSSRPWYDFVTSLIAIIGGTYAVVQLCGGAADNIHLARRVPAKRL
jgi:hypothetical protein